ncbi:hypothetical protein D3C80_1234790 [compost metagenome]
MVPPCRSTKSLTSARPRPVPPNSRVFPPWARRKRSKIVERISGATPQPLSWTLSSRRSFPLSSRAHLIRPPAGVNLKALESRLSRMPSNFSGSTSASSVSGAVIT